jgi:hypothetical protein
MAFRHLETSLQRIHKGVFQDVQKADYEFSGPFAYLKHHLNNFVQVAFFLAQVAENELAWPFDTLKQHFIEFLSFFFKTFRKLILNSQGH